MDFDSSLTIFFSIFIIIADVFATLVSIASVDGKALTVKLTMPYDITTSPIDIAIMIGIRALFTSLNGFRFVCGSVFLRTKQVMLASSIFWAMMLIASITKVAVLILAGNADSGTIVSSVLGFLWTIVHSVTSTCIWATENEIIQRRRRVHPIQGPAPRFFEV